MSNQIGYRPRQEPFQPNREYVEKAIEDFLSTGGVIKMIQVDWDHFNPAGFVSYADSFLMSNAKNAHLL